MNMNRALIGILISIVAFTGLAILMLIVGIVYLAVEKVTIPDIMQIALTAAFGIFTTTIAYMAQSPMPRRSNDPQPVVIEQPAHDPVPVEAQ